MGDLKKALVIIALFCISSTLQAPSRDDALTWTGNLAINWKYEKDYNVDAAFADENHHALAVLNCTNFSSYFLGQCRLTVVRHYWDRSEREETCDIKPLDVGNEIRVYELRFLKADKIAISWEGRHIANPLSSWAWKRSVQIISTDSCEKSEYLKIRGYGRVDNHKPYFFIEHEDYFEVIHVNEDNECPTDKFCKRKFAYNGIGVGSAFHVSFPTSDMSSPNKFFEIDNVHLMESSSLDKYVINGRFKDNDGLPENLYSPLMGYMKLDQLSDPHAYSNTSGFATICWREVHHGGAGLSCKWLDGTYGDKTFHIASYFSNSVPATINTPDGNILLVTFGGVSAYTTRVIVEEARVDNKCKRLADFDWRGKLTSFKISLAKDGKLCISTLWHYRVKDEDDNDVGIRRYKFSTKCIELQKNAEWNSKCGAT